MRSMPASMMTSRTTSVTSRLMAVGLPEVSMLVITQVVATGTHTARVC